MKRVNNENNMKHFEERMSNVFTTASHKDISNATLHTSAPTPTQYGDKANQTTVTHIIDEEYNLYI